MDLTLDTSVFSYTITTLEGGLSFDQYRLANGWCNIELGLVFCKLIFTLKL